MWLAQAALLGKALAGFHFDVIASRCGRRHACIWYEKNHGSD
jgi:hypothetical protein